MPKDILRLLDDGGAAANWFALLGISDSHRAHDTLVQLSESGVTLDLMSEICQCLADELPTLSDPDMALANFRSFMLANRSPLALATLFQRDTQSLPILLQILSTSQYLSDLLVDEPEAFDLLRITGGQPVARSVLANELLSEIRAIDDLPSISQLIGRFRQREILRIAYGDIVRQQRLEIVTGQLSHLADAMCQAALDACHRQLVARHGVPRRADGEEASSVIIATGKLGGVEMSYSSPLDVMLLYDDDGQTDGEHRLDNQEFFGRLAQSFVDLLSGAGEKEDAYVIRFRPRPTGDTIVTDDISANRESAVHGDTAAHRDRAAAWSVAAAIDYFEVYGCTWQRQALVKARPIAGDADLGRRFLVPLEGWIYRRYLNRADITEIQALKRRIERHASSDDDRRRNIQVGYGGIRDIEFVIQFLQLLNGADLPAIRIGNTLDAIAQLEQTGCLDMRERSILEENYAMLRKIEHRLQIMLGVQADILPDNDAEMRKLAIRMGFSDAGETSALEVFKNSFAETTRQNRRILDHLLHDVFRGDQTTEPVVDLVLDPEPSDQQKSTVLQAYGFRDIGAAFEHLMDLSSERIRFLSSRRCRHFLAGISPRLLQAIADTPDPDATLANLRQVSDSLGGKGVLWEILSLNGASLELYVRLCATSPYLSGILTGNPGMIDELMDSLVLDRLPEFETLRYQLNDLCRRAQQLRPILQSFKNSRHLFVGVRDILGKEDIRNTTAALADISEVCLQQIVLDQYHRLVERYGYPGLSDERDQSLHDDRPHQRVVDGRSSLSQLPMESDGCQLVVLALGKLGGREPNYHSDCEVLFLYEGDGMTRPVGRSRSVEITTNQHFFGELAQQILRFTNEVGPDGRLFPLSVPLRPHGVAAPLAMTFEDFRRFYADGGAERSQRQALCCGRPIFGSGEARQTVVSIVHDAITDPPWRTTDSRSLVAARDLLEKTAAEDNLKRGPGGTVDVEFTVQMLQMRHAREHPNVLRPGTWSGLDALYDQHVLSEEDWRFFGQSYRFLRGVEARLRLMDSAARHDLPKQEVELKTLAYLLRRADPNDLRTACRGYMEENRRRFHRTLDA